MRDFSIVIVRVLSPVKRALFFHLQTKLTVTIWFSCVPTNSWGCFFPNFCIPCPVLFSSCSFKSMLYEEAMPPTMTMVLAMGPKLLVKSAVERNLTAKAREDYTSGEVAQLCAAAVHVIMRSGVEYEEVNNLVCSDGLHFC